MCRHETNWAHPDQQTDALFAGLDRMKELEKDGLISFSHTRLQVTRKGLPFIRNICQALDARYWAKRPEGALFSQAV